MPTHKTHMFLSYLAVAIFTAVLLTFTIYLIWAQGHNKWPFYKKSGTEIPKMQKSNTFYESRESSKEVNKESRISATAGIIIFFIFLIFIGIIIYFTMRANIERYKIAGDALRHGHAGVAAAALAPEIGAGIGNVLGSNTRYY